MSKLLFSALMLSLLSLSFQVKYCNSRSREKRSNMNFNVVSKVAINRTNIPLPLTNEEARTYTKAHKINLPLKGGDTIFITGDNSMGNKPFLPLYITLTAMKKRR